MKKSIFFGVILVSVWVMWASLGRSVELIEPTIHLDTKEVISTTSTCDRNVVAIQPYMLTEDYTSESHFYEKIKAYFEEASQAGYFNPNTVVLLPEYLGTWLVISGEKGSVSDVRHIKGAMTIMILSNPIKFIQAYLKNVGEDDSFGASLFRMKADEMARIYSEIFIELSTHYNVTIIPGSILLPGPSVMDNKIKVELSKPIYNTSFVFRPTGEIEQQIVKKSFPITSELPLISANPTDELGMYDLPIGKTAVLVCADSWYPESYVQIKKLNAEVVLVNSFSTGNNIMSSKWNGYDGKDEPKDVNQQDIGEISEKEAWVKYALPGRISNSSAVIGVNVFLRGALWDLGSDGQPFFIKNGNLIDSKPSDHAGIWNFCF